jgi:hypothetical protein
LYCWARQQSCDLLLLLPRLLLRPVLLLMTVQYDPLCRDRGTSLSSEIFV